MLPIQYEKVSIEDKYGGQIRSHYNVRPKAYLTFNKQIDGRSYYLAFLGQLRILKKHGKMLKKTRLLLNHQCCNLRRKV